MRISATLQQSLLDEVRLRVRAGFTFHNVGHAEDVCLAVSRILLHYPEVPASRAEEFEMAALLHDISYCEGADGHEQRGKAVAIQVLQQHGIPSDVANRVGELIVYTTVGLAPSSLDSKIMRDADVFHIGTPTGKSRSLDFFQEQVNQGRAISREEWYRSEIRFLRQQHFFLDWLEEERRHQRESVIRELESALGII